MLETGGGAKALEDALEAMLLDNEDVTARGAVRRSNGAFKHASDITRPPDRRALLEAYQARQASLRSLMGKTDKQSREHLAAKLAAKDDEIARLRSERDLLIASHRAMILAVGEVGAMRSWRRLYERQKEALDRLEAIGATPAAEVVALSPKAVRGPRPVEV